MIDSSARSPVWLGSHDMVSGVLGIPSGPVGPLGPTGPSQVATSKAHRERILLVSRMVNCLLGGMLLPRLGVLLASFLVARSKKSPTGRSLSQRYGDGPFVVPCG